MSDSTESRGLLATLRGLGSTLSATISNRIELLLVELQIERVRFLHILVLLLATAIFAFLCILALTAALVVFLWDTNPVLVLVAVGLLYGGGAWMTARGARAMIDQEAFAGSLMELKKDQKCLNPPHSAPSNSVVDSSSRKAS